MRDRSSQDSKLSVWPRLAASILAANGAQTRWTGSGAEGGVRGWICLRQQLTRVMIDCWRFHVDAVHTPPVPPDDHRSDYPGSPSQARLCGNPPGSLAAGVALRPSPTLPSEPLSCFAFSDSFAPHAGALLVLQRQAAHALTVVVGHATKQCVVFKIEPSRALKPGLCRTIFAPFLNADWLPSPWQTPLLALHCGLRF